MRLSFITWEILAFNHLNLLSGQIQVLKTLINWNKLLRYSCTVIIAGIKMSGDSQRSQSEWMINLTEVIRKRLEFIYEDIRAAKITYKKYINMSQILTAMSVQLMEQDDCETASKITRNSAKANKEFLHWHNYLCKLREDRSNLQQCLKWLNSQDVCDKKRVKIISKKVQDELKKLKTLKFLFFVSLTSGRDLIVTCKA